MRQMLRGCLVFVWFGLLPALAFAQAELKVFVGGAVTQPVKEAGAAFARSSGNTLVYVSDTTGALQKRLASGEKADLVVVASPAMDTLQKENRVVPGSRIDLARALPIGVGVRAGASSPDLSTPDAFQGRSPQGPLSFLRQSRSGWDVWHLFRGTAAAHGHHRRDERKNRLSDAGLGSG